MPTRRKRFKARYKVNIALKAWDIAKAGSGITVRVKDKYGVLGTMEIGQGSLRWKPQYSPRFKRIPWSKFADALSAL
jgi:hypothetical protein